MTSFDTDTMTFFQFAIAQKANGEIVGQTTWATFNNLDGLVGWQIMEKYPLDYSFRNTITAQINNMRRELS